MMSRGTETQAAHWTQISRYFITPPLLRYKSGLRWFASAANSLIADQYLKDAGTPEEIRDAFTEMIGDMLMALPVVTVAGYLSGL
ncbi:hypothetical protein NQZ68_030180 [Dissostichus eleginoides]|nr:hypothetical protein NQZ68_030180 [Dissostichus eleginoides]